MKIRQIYEKYGELMIWNLMSSTGELLQWIPCDDDPITVLPINALVWERHDGQK
jgi:hypothetical protein